MRLGKVTGRVVSSQKDEGLGGAKLLIAQILALPAMSLTEDYVVAIDTVGAGEGDVVLIVAGSSARMADGMSEKPVDSAIHAIIDTVNFEGKTVYSGSGSAVEA